MSERMEEEILRDVLLEAVAREYGEIMDTEEDIPVSRRYQKEMYAMCEDPMGWAKRKSRPLWKKCVRIAAMIFLTITILLTLVMTVSPKARATMTTWVEDWYNQFMEYRESEGKAEEEYNSLTKYEITEVPTGYWTIEMDKNTTNYGWQSYENNRSSLILLKYTDLYTGCIPWVETSGMAVSDVSVNGCAGHMFVCLDNRQASVVSWRDEKAGIQFYIEGYVSKDDLLNMAKSVRLVRSTK